jgi:hypothetical protein
MRASSPVFTIRPAWGKLDGSLRELLCSFATACSWNSAKLDFGKLMAIYVVLFFVVGQGKVIRGNSFVPSYLSPLRNIP